MNSRRNAWKWPYDSLLCPLSWSTNNLYDWQISLFSQSWFIVWTLVCALVGRNISQNLFFLGATWLVPMLKTITIPWLAMMTALHGFARAPLGDKSCLPESLKWVKFLKPPVVPQPCSFTCPPQFQLSPSTCVFLVPFEATMGCYSMWNSAANVNIIMLEWTCLSTYKREFNRRRWFKTTIGMKISQSMQPAPSYSAILALHLSTDRHFDALAYTIAFRNILQRKHAFR